MWPFKKKTEVEIIDTGNHLPPVTMEQEIRFLSEQDRFIKIEVEKQTRRTGNIIYGAQSVNKQVGPWYSRPTSDFDIMSSSPRSHAVELEKKIDNHVNANIAHVEQVSYDRDGQKGKMYRVALKNFNPLIDYNPKPKNVPFVMINGIKYEKLNRQEKKCMKMINEGDTKRIINANQDLNRIHLFKYWKKIF